MCNVSSVHKQMKKRESGALVKTMGEASYKYKFSFNAIFEIMTDLVLIFYSCKFWVYTLGKNVLNEFHYLIVFFDVVEH